MGKDGCDEGQQQVVLTYVVVHGISGLIDGSCVWAWWLECKVGLGCCDDRMLCARHWASGGWLNAWTSASRLMAITLCAACGHTVWAVVLMEGLEHGPSLSKMCGNKLYGLLEDGQRPHGLLRHGLCMCNMCSGSY